MGQGRTFYRANALKVNVKVDMGRDRGRDRVMRQLSNVLHPLSISSILSVFVV